MELRDAVARELPKARADLERLVRIPAVSADPARHSEVRRSAETVAELMSDAGAADVQILTVEGGQPAVVGRWPGPAGAPTVLLYAHHDVQPTGDLAEWTTKPFEPTEREGRLYGRGTADNRNGAAAHFAVLRAFEGKPPVNVVMLVEGEEEIGSPTLGPFLETYRDQLAADVIVLADSANWDVGAPALTTSLRGLADCVVEVRTGKFGVHSGMYGGPAVDALTALSRLLATLHDDHGNVAVEGLAGGRATDVAYDESRYRAEAGLVDGLHLVGTGTLVERLWTKPAISVLAIDAPRVAEASNTLVPVARAKVSLRTAPGEDSRKALDSLVAHLASRAPWGAEVSVRRGDVGQGFAVSAQGPAYDAMRSAMRDVYGVEPVEVGVGGTIPFIATFAETFPGAAVIVCGSADPASRMHGVDESLDLAEFDRFILAEAVLIQSLGQAPPG